MRWRWPVESIDAQSAPVVIWLPIGCRWHPRGRSRSLASLTIKNIPDQLLHRLREVAERERRSITQQVLCMLEQVLKIEGSTTSSALGTDYETNHKERP